MKRSQIFLIALVLSLVAFAQPAYGSDGLVSDGWTWNEASADVAPATEAPAPDADAPTPDANPPAPDAPAPDADAPAPDGWTWDEALSADGWTWDEAALTPPG
jgi:hypothetical protein